MTFVANNLVLVTMLKFAVPFKIVTLFALKFKAVRLVEETVAANKFVDVTLVVVPFVAVMPPTCRDCAEVFPCVKT